MRQAAKRSGGEVQNCLQMLNIDSEEAFCKKQ